MLRQDARELCDRWRHDLEEAEASPATVERYVREARHLLQYMSDSDLELTRATVLAYKEHLIERRAPTGVNTALAALNRLFSFLAMPELRLRRLKVQATSRSAVQGLSRQEYKRLVAVARKEHMEKECLVIQTLCSTGMRVSELVSVTVESLYEGFATVTNKGRTRRVWFPPRLCTKLKKFALQYGIDRGPVFITRTGSPVDRTYVWRMLKKLSLLAGITTAKVFPHALRHLFAATFQSKNNDVESLAGVLGHTRIETTRLYLAIDEQKRKTQVARLGLV